MKSKISLHKRTMRTLIDTYSTPKIKCSSILFNQELTPDLPGTEKIHADKGVYID